MQYAVKAASGLAIKMGKKYHAVGTVPKSNIKIT